jgi:hypothetical protein
VRPFSFNQETGDRRQQTEVRIEKLERAGGFASGVILLNFVPDPVPVADALTSNF